jgi:hypothetical protein
MKKVMLFGALIALFASSNLYAASCSDTDTDGYDDACDAEMRLDLPQFVIIEFPGAVGLGTSDLNVVWDGTAATLTDSIDICIGTNSDTGVDVSASSTNAVPWNVNDGTTDVPYTLTLDGADLTDGGTDTIVAADVQDLACTVSDLPLELGFTQAALEATPTDGTTHFTDIVTITVSPN